MMDRTNSDGMGPWQFPLRSAQSRASARAELRRRQREAAQDGTLVILVDWPFEETEEPRTKPDTVECYEAPDGSIVRIFTIDWQRTGKRVIRILTQRWPDGGTYDGQSPVQGIAEARRLPDASEGYREPLMWCIKGRWPVSTLLVRSARTQSGANVEPAAAGPAAGAVRSSRTTRKKISEERAIQPAGEDAYVYASEKQSDFLRSLVRRRFVLYGGAMGGGKSFILRWWLLGYLMWLAQDCGVRGAQVGLFCEDYPTLRDRQISRIEAEFPRELGALKRGVTLDFVLRDEYGGGRIALRNLDDPSKYQSTEFAGIAVDELTKNPRSTFDLLRTRLRWPGVDRPKFAAATNPGGVGHGWVKALWVDRRFPLELAPLADEFAFVPARAEDNPHLSASYYEELKTLPPDLARAYAEGNWDLFAGQFFDVWDPQRHVIRGEEVKLETWWPRWISIDWGFAHNSAVYWHAYDGKTVFTYRELVENRLTPRELAFKIAERSVMTCTACKGASAGCSICAGSGVQRESIEHVYLSHDAFARKTEEKTAALQMCDVLRERKLPEPTPADTDRKGGWMLMYQLLRDGKWKVADSCQALIATMPILVRDERDIEDVAKMDGDDPADAARYGLKGRFGRIHKPIEERAAQVVTSTDPTIRAIQAMKFAADQKPKVFGFRRRRHSRWATPSQQR